MKKLINPGVTLIVGAGIARGGSRAFRPFPLTFGLGTMPDRHTFNCGMTATLKDGNQYLYAYRAYSEIIPITDEIEALNKHPVPNWQGERGGWQFNHFTRRTCWFKERVL